MDVENKVSGKCEYDTAGELSRWFFLWTFRLFRLGAHKDLELSDIRLCCSDDEPSRVTQLLENEWEKEMDRHVSSGFKYSPSLVKAIMRAFAARYIISNIIVIAGEMIKLAQPFLIGLIIMYLQSSNSVSSNGDSSNSVSSQQAIAAAIAFIMCNVVSALTRHRGNILATRVGNNVRTAITALIMKKLLRVSMSALGETDVGQIMNVLANDLTRFEDLSWYAAFILCAPILVIFVFVVTLRLLKTACLGGIILLIAFVVLESYMGRFFNLFRTKTALLTDERVRLMSELLSSIKLIKVYCWETPHSAKVDHIRKVEMKRLRSTYLLKGINNGLFFIATRFMLFTSYLIRVLQGFPLDPYTTFVTISLYDSIRLPVTGFFSNAIGVGAETFSACDRIRTILMMREKAVDHNDTFSPTKYLQVADNSGNSSNNSSRKSANVSQQERPPSALDGSIVVDAMSSRWTNKMPLDTLSDMTFTVRPGELVIVIGKVGAGKSCLLYSLLRETEITGGEVAIHGDVSYAPQEPWCFGSTVKQNILLTGGNFLADKYNTVMDVCALRPDLKVLPDGEDTYVGERGFSLSGGQKARISLARCVYQDASIYLMDDPLSAVDPKVANHIFNKCIRGYLRGKTVILVTHQLQFLHLADRILYLEDGRIKSFASYRQMMHSGIDLGTLVSEETPEADEADSARAQRTPSFSLSVRKDTLSHKLSVASLSGRSMSLNTEEVIDDGSFDIVEEQGKQPATAEREEQRTTGKLKAQVYIKYLTIGGKPLLLMAAIVTSLTAQAVYQLNDAWLSAWSEYRPPDVLALASEGNVTLSPGANDSSPQAQVQEDEESHALAANLLFDSQAYNIALYCGLTAALFGLGFLRASLTFVVCLASSVRLHDLVFKKLLRAPMSFFEQNPLGRILNRVTRDIGIVDQTIPSTLIELISVGMQVIGVIAITVVKQPYLAIAVVVLTFLAVPIRNMYIETARDLQRLDSVARSPVYDMISSALSGLIPIRSFKLEKQFEAAFDGLLSDSVSARFYVMSAQRTVGLLLDILASIYIAIVAIAVLVSSTGASAGDAGLILASSLQLMAFFQYAIRTSADYETQMVSCERVLEYGSLESEAELYNAAEDSRHPEWPQNGAIEFRKVNMWYSPSLPRVLKDVSFTVAPGEKVGIVGRTGAGKSSLLSLLFRLVELQRAQVLQDQSGGKILIDGVDISLLGLHYLRSRVSIIPQEPVLFSGTIRSNLDPFARYPEHRLWHVLQLSSLNTAVSALGGLSAPVSEGGCNLSLGQRQLLCLARALLKDNRILVCDEATANVDKQTDHLIQQTIKQQFQRCTVLTIAHRLNTIIQMDKVLVLDGGCVLEYGEPYELLTRGPKGHFHMMVKETGDEYERSLTSLAKAAHEERIARASNSLEPKDE